MSFPLSLLILVSSPDLAQARLYAGLARRLSQRHKLAVVVWGQTGGAALFAEELEQLRVPSLSLQNPGRIHWLRRRAVCAKLRAFLGEMRPEVMHLSASPADLLPLRILLAGGVPALYAPAVLGLLPGEGGVKAALRRERKLTALCRGMMLATDWQQEWVGACRPSVAGLGEVLVVPPGIDTTVFAPPPVEHSASLNPEAQGEPERENTAALAAERIERARASWRVRLGAGVGDRVVGIALEPGDLPGLTFFFQMASRLYYLSKTVRFAVSGFTELPALLGRGCPEDLRERFFWAGTAAGPEELVAFYRGVDVLVGRGRGLEVPLTLLEGQACGAAGVMLAGAGAEAVIRDGENGLMVSGSWMELARVVDDLLRDPERLERISAWGRVGVEQHFSLTQTLPQLERLYRCVRTTSPGSSLADAFYNL